MAPAPRSPTDSPYFFSPAVTDRFDVVGFDPRGIAFSKNVKCFSVGTPRTTRSGQVINSAAFPYGAKQEKAFIKAYDKHAQGLFDDRQAAHRGRCRQRRWRGTWICSAVRWVTRS